ncbi:MAG: hypothetical protein Q4G51_05945 [Dermatophilus congolensis]|nr:hypothetical protein [Dermatophilus congolensis]
MTRALAAEIRHNHESVTALLEAALRDQQATPVRLGRVTGVECESVQRLDVLVEFDSGAEKATRLGIEGKFDHWISEEQLLREKEAVDYLVLVVADESHAHDVKDIPHATLTWQQILAGCKDSRLTLDDLHGIATPKAEVERRLREAMARHPLPQGWQQRIARGASGMPGIEFSSPPLPSGRTLNGHIEVAGRGLPASTDEVELTYLVGVSVDNTPDDLPPADESDQQPTWITHLKILAKIIDTLAAQGVGLRVSRSKASPGRTTYGVNKLPLVDKYLSGRTWLAKGYTDGWALGVRSTRVNIAQVDTLHEEATTLFTQWHEGCCGVGRHD